MKLLTLLSIGTLALAMGCQSDGLPVAKAPEKSTSNELTKTVDNKSAADDHEAEEAALEQANRISLDDAKKDFDNGTAAFVDTRGKAFYDNEHVKGALNVPSSDFDNTYKRVPKDKKIIAYCS
jgi:3-mercaptopyruvate sulfurtransferase SseA